MKSVIRKQIGDATAVAFCRIIYNQTEHHFNWML